MRGQGPQRIQWLSRQYGGSVWNQLGRRPCRSPRADREFLAEPRRSIPARRFGAKGGCCCGSVEDEPGTADHWHRRACTADLLVPELGVGCGFPRRLWRRVDERVRIRRILRDGHNHADHCGTRARRRGRRRDGLEASRRLRSDRWTSGSRHVRLGAGVRPRDLKRWAWCLARSCGVGCDRVGRVRGHARASDCHSPRAYLRREETDRREQTDRAVRTTYRLTWGAESDIVGG